MNIGPLSLWVASGPSSNIKLNRFWEETVLQIGVQKVYTRTKKEERKRESGKKVGCHTEDKKKTKNRNEVGRNILQHYYA